MHSLQAPNRAIEGSLQRRPRPGSPSAKRAPSHDEGSETLMSYPATCSAVSDAQRSGSMATIATTTRIVDSSARSTAGPCTTVVHRVLSLFAPSNATPLARSPIQTRYLGNEAPRLA